MIEFWNNSKKKNPSNVSKKGKQKITPIPGIEPGSQHGECRVIAITLYRTFYEKTKNRDFLTLQYWQLSPISNPCCIHD